VPRRSASTMRAHTVDVAARRVGTTATTASDSRGSTTRSLALRHRERKGTNALPLSTYSREGGLRQAPRPAEESPGLQAWTEGGGGGRRRDRGGGRTDRADAGR
jgi:hypothetical protein